MQGLQARPAAAPLPATTATLRGRTRSGKRLRAALAAGVWWILSIGLVVVAWEAAAAFHLIDPVILPPPHEFIGEIRNQAQFLMPAVGVERTGANFVALTAIVASVSVK